MSLSKDGVDWPQQGEHRDFTQTNFVDGLEEQLREGDEGNRDTDHGDHTSGDLGLAKSLLVLRNLELLDEEKKSHAAAQSKHKIKSSTRHFRETDAEDNDSEVNNNNQDDYASNTEDCSDSFEEEKSSYNKSYALTLTRPRTTPNQRHSTKSAKSHSRIVRRPQTSESRLVRRPGQSSRDLEMREEPYIQRLFGVRKQKKTLDTDCQKLENRIKLLQLEESKMELKIRKAKDDVKAVEKRRAERRELKLHGPLETRLEPTRRAFKEKNALQNQIHRVSKARTQTLVEVERKERAREIKKSKQKMRQALIKQRLANEEAVAEKREQIRLMREATRASKIQAEAEKHAKVQHDLQEKLAWEELERKQRLRKLHKLEKIEQEHIDRLKAKQAVQQEARRALERALNLPGSGSNVISALSTESISSFLTQ